MPPGRRGRGARGPFGAADVRNLGPAVIGESADIAQPDFNFGPQSRDEVRQTTGGIGHELRWPRAAGRGAAAHRAPPDRNFGPPSRDEVRQIPGGIGYELRWPRVAELSLGLQRTDYEKNSFIPGRPTLTTEDSPWLYNGTLAIHLTDRLVAYAGYTRGLEESGPAPSPPAHRDEAPPPPSRRPHGH